MEKPKRNAVSFGFTKKVETKKLEKSAVDETSNILNGDTEQTDFVTSLEGKKIKSTIPKQEGKKHFIIPLIKENRWRYDLNGKKGDDDLESKAVREILETTAHQNQEWEDRDKPDPNLSVPLLMKNKVPDGFETDDKLNVSLRPDEPEEVNYESIPIEQFGFAMLRGMGWKDGEGLGKDKNIVDPVHAVLRPKGLGLGADKRQHAQNEVNGQDNNGEESLTYKKGAFCVLTKGPQKDLYGTIVGIDEDNARVVVKLTLSGQTATLSQYGIQLVGQKEYEKYSKYLNKSKVDKYKKENENNVSGHKSKYCDERECVKENSNEDTHRGKGNSNHEERNSHSHGSKHDRHKSKHSKKSKHHHYHDYDDGGNKSKHSRHKTESDSERKRRHGKDFKTSDDSDLERKRKHGKDYKTSDEAISDSDIGTKTRKTDCGSSDHHRPSTNKEDGSTKIQTRDFRNEIWVCPNMKVRIIDRNFKSGKYFRSKVVVVDVLSKDCCVCKTDDGQILENLSQDCMETVIPRDSGDHKAVVMLTATSDKGRIGEIISRNKVKNELVVRLFSSGYNDENIVRLDNYDYACEYTGALE